MVNILILLLIIGILLKLFKFAIKSIILILLILFFGSLIVKILILPFITMM